MTTQFWLATSNKGKINELKMLLADLPLDLHSQGELAVYSPPDETGKTFEENARIKAKSLRAIRNTDWIVGEDSGLVVEGLGGLPGIHSARYAGPKAADAENVAKLLKMMQIRFVANRSAKFVTTLVVYSPSGQEYVFSGEVAGEIAKAPRGTAGFGYDPVFVPQGYDKTIAELEPKIKNAISHRAQAVAKMRESLASVWLSHSPEKSQNS